ncbi:uncharacterized protein LOC126774408 [Nymphalis io]|uniref:uncharacterized protein LOC126774408 n=1 Tax=Inachis io TaxID=171585 RepID=UPI0021684F3D|nr:uncharacterized protein LOC126774408 [Nymphalis io]
MASDEETLLLLLLRHRRRQRKRKTRSVWVEEILMYREQEGDFYTLYPRLRRSEKKFFNYFRMSIASFDELTSILKLSISRQDTVMRKSIPAEQRLAMTLRFLATGCSFEDLQYAYRCGISTISNIIKDVCQQVWLNMRDDILPQNITEETWKRIADRFERHAQFPNCIGAVDGKHIRIFKPGNSGSSHYNYKNYFSIILLAICDSDYKFIFCDIGCYGRHSDSTIFEDTIFFTKLQEKSLNIPKPRPISTDGCTLPYVLIGDEAFSLSENLLRPYPGKRLTEKMRIFNYRLTRARRYVECSFGILTNKWRIFHTPMKLSLEFCKDVVKACCILHNFVRDRDGFTFEDTLTINGLENIATIPNEGDSLSGPIIREKFSDYFSSSEGSVSWQLDCI